MVPIKYIIVLTVSLFASLQVASVAAGKLDKIVDLSNALEAICKNPKLRIKFKIIEDSVAEYEQLSEKQKYELDKNNMGQLALDFAIIPAQLNKDMLDEFEYREMFITRLIEQYCGFRKAYAYGMHLDGHLPRSPKALKIVNIGLGKQAGEVNLEDFYQAQSELNTWRKTFDHIRKEEDIYSNLKTFKQLWDLFIYDCVKILREDIFPKLSPKQDPKVLMNEYVKLLRKAGFQIRTPPAFVEKKSGPTKEQLDKTLPTW